MLTELGLKPEEADKMDADFIDDMMVLLKERKKMESESLRV